MRSPPPAASHTALVFVHFPTAPKKFNDLVPGKRTLVLDIDYTLFE